MEENFNNQIKEVLNNETLNQVEIISKLKHIISETEFKNYNNRPTKTMANIVSENILKKIANPEYSQIIKTGFNAFDENFAGFTLGELIIIGARPGMGKTQLLINLCLNISKEIPILFFTFDLSSDSLAERFLSCHTGIRINNQTEVNLTQQEKNKILNTEQELSNYKIYLNDDFSHSISALKQECIKQIEEHGIKIIIVDYLQLMGSFNYKRNRETEVSYISRELKKIAKENNVCVIVSSQLNRSVELRPGGAHNPKLSDLRDSGAIEQDADKVIFIYRPEYYGINIGEEGESTSGLIELQIAKNRNGILNNIKLYHDKNFLLINETNYNKLDFDFNPDKLNDIENPF